MTAGASYDSASRDSKDISSRAVALPSLAHQFTVTVKGIPCLILWETMQ